MTKLSTALSAIALAALGSGCNGLLDLDGYEYGPGASGGGSVTGGSGTTGGASSGGGGSSQGGNGAAGTGASGAGGGGGWHDPAYGYRREVTVANPTADTHDDVPVLAVLNDMRIEYSEMQDDGDDLRFFASDGDPLPFEVELWDSTGDSFVWVKVPELASPDTKIWMYYGDPDADGAQNAADVWSNDYLAVWHMTAALPDSTGAHALTSQGGSEVTGVAGGCRNLDGSDDYLTVGAPVGLDGLFGGGATFSAWIRPSGWGGGGFGRIADKATDSSGGGGWAVFVTSGEFGLRRGFSGGTAGWRSPASSLTLDTWASVAVTYDDGLGAPSLYINGTSQAVETTDAPSGTPTDDTGVAARIGNAVTTTGRSFDGEIDEMRISSTIRSVSWLVVQYRSMRDQLLTYGAAEAYVP